MLAAAGSVTYCGAAAATTEMPGGGGGGGGGCSRGGDTGGRDYRVIGHEDRRAILKADSNGRGRGRARGQIGDVMAAVELAHLVFFFLSLIH